LERRRLMDLRLTDILTCPRCGPEFGLILLADRVEEGRILEGAFGCPNCRERYPVVAGFGDLRVPPAPPLTGEAPQTLDDEAAFRLAALMDLAEAGGWAILAGAGGRLAAALAALAVGVEVVAVDARLAGWDEQAGLTRMAAEGRLPFRDGRMRAVALTADVPESLLAEAARVVVPGGRLVLDPAPAGAASRLYAAGCHVLAAEAGTIVARRG
jgi:uncharacterized protein YbaR (Trm112 family)